MKDYICRCNNCDNILIDENPKIDAKEAELTGSELYMEKFSDEDHDSFWGCPVCETDAYLIDIEYEE